MASIVAISLPSSLSITSRPPHSNFIGSGRRSTVVVRAQGSGGEPINPAIRKTEDKVVDSVLIAELSKPLTPYCRCWRSATFPLCDGSHVKHNKATGDNVGPLLLKQ
ncbi:CDGSH iron-sulfur domain-containing protein NEET [Benincasa hispida]|uniref:CDGSH iron-sulfur domain-containing protein NEET n=1 Tax=Benincasa hispida TaxID=102211 RepID=UPI00190042EF|nr:CDGSH iron-sulfur domain-containing protein NEET [Benincasa hispida]